MLARRLCDMAIPNICSAGLPHGASNKLTSAVRASIVRLQSTIGAKCTFMGANVGRPVRLQGGGTLLTARFHFERHNQDRKAALSPSVLQIFGAQEAALPITKTTSRIESQPKLKVRMHPEPNSAGSGIGNELCTGGASKVGSVSLAIR